MSGNHAAFATPTRCCAASSAILRRRDVGTAREDGGGNARRDRPAGASSHVAAPSVEVGGSSPTSTASACSSSARRRSSASASDSVAATSVRDARDIELGHVACAEAALGQALRVEVGRTVLAHQLALGVDRAQCQVGLRHLGLHEQARALQQPLARHARRAPRPAMRLREAAEEVDLVGEVRADRESVSALPAARCGSPSTRTAAGADAQLGPAVGVGDARHGAGLREASGGLLHARVGGVGALDQLRPAWNRRTPSTIRRAAAPRAGSTRVQRPSPSL